MDAPGTLKAPQKPKMYVLLPKSQLKRVLQKGIRLYKQQLAEEDERRRQVQEVEDLMAEVCVCLCYRHDVCVRACKHVCAPSVHTHVESKCVQVHCLPGRRCNQSNLNINQFKHPDHVLLTCK